VIPRPADDVNLVAINHLYYLLTIQSHVPATRFIFI